MIASAHILLLLTCLLILALANALFIQGVSISTYYELGPDGEPTAKKFLWRLRYHGEAVIGEYWMQPILTCTVCMSSVWGTAVVLLVNHFSNLLGFWEMSIYLPVHVLIVAGINHLINKE